MSQQRYRQAPQPQYRGPYGPQGTEGFPYPYPKRGLGPMGVASIVLGVFCLILVIVLMVVWAGKRSAQSGLKQEMMTNSELADERIRLKRESGNLTRKIEYHKRQALATRKDTPLTGENAPKAGTPAYWKARYEKAKRECKGWEMAANRYKAILDQAGKLKTGPGQGSGP